MSNLLDLQRKPQPEIRIIERIVLKKRVWWVELLQTFAVLLVIVGVSWAVSHAEIVSKLRDSRDANKVISNIRHTNATTTKFSAIGIVSSLVDGTLVLSDAKGTGHADIDATYTFDTTTLTTIETNKYSPLVLSDIHTGDKIIVQGLRENGIMIANRIISFGVSKVTATTTEEVATSTPETATTTPATAESIFATSTSATSTPDFTETSDSATTTVEIATSTPVDISTASSSPPQTLPTEPPAPDPVVTIPPHATLPEDLPSVGETPAEIPPLE